MATPAPSAEPTAWPAALTVTEEQAAHLDRALTLSKALASPGRLAILGALARDPTAGCTLDDLAARTRLRPSQMERDLRLLADAGLLRVEEWAAPGPGREPAPARLAFTPDYAAQMTGVIATLHQWQRQVRPPAPKPALDERARTLARFMPNGRIVAWPVQRKRVLYLLDAVAPAVAPGRRYTEREVDAILKEFYPEDHCTLRRALVDERYLRRADGIYWRTSNE